MNRFEDIGRQLQKSGKAERLKQLADSPDGQRISQMLDPKAVEAAAKSGDSAAMSGIIARILSTDEGRRIAESLKQLMD